MTNRKQALQELLAKVEAGNVDHGCFNQSWHGDPSYSGGCGVNAHKAYDGSLDAALALHNAVLPRWDWQIEDNIEAYVARIGPACVEFMPSIMGISFDSAAHSWLIAILKALIAGEDE